MPKAHSKTGNRHGGSILQPRDRHLLIELSILKIADSRQLQMVAPFGSVRRTNDRLHRLVAGKVLRRFFIGTVSGGKKAVYALSPAGAAIVGTKAPAIGFAQDQLITADTFISHQLQIGEVYLACTYQALPEHVRVIRWRSFSMPLSQSIRLIPDGYLELLYFDKPLCMFIEVDMGSESLKIWQQKTAAYLQLAMSGEFARLFSREKFRVLAVANSDKRISSLRRLIAASIDKIFWFTTAPAISTSGLCKSIWQRPTGDQVQSLFTQS
jgi:Replication-relaxation